MKLLEDLRISFETTIWFKFPGLAVYDTILENKIDIIQIFADDLSKNLKNNKLGRKDKPNAKQIVRANIYKEERKRNGLNRYNSRVITREALLDIKSIYQVEKVI